MVTKIIINFYLLSRKRASRKDRKIVKSKKLQKASDSHHHRFSGVPLILSSDSGESSARGRAPYSGDWEVLLQLGTMEKLTSPHGHWYPYDIHTTHPVHCTCRGVTCNGRSLFTTITVDCHGPLSTDDHYHTRSLPADCSDSVGNGETN